MMKKLLIGLYALLTSVAACSFLLIRYDLRWLILLVPLFLLCNLLPGFFWVRSKQKHLHFCCHGAQMLVIFLFSNALYSQPGGGAAGLHRLS